VKRGATTPSFTLKPLLRAAFIAFSVLISGALSAQVTTADTLRPGQEGLIEAVTAHHPEPDAAIAQATAHGEEGLNPGKLIMGHVGDEHGWHLFGHTTLPLPVILYNTQRGLSIFSSGHFHHGEETYGGYMLREGKVVAVNESGSIPAAQATVNDELTSAIWDISITKNVLAMFISLIIMLLVFLSVANAYRRRGSQAPKGLQSFIEPIIVFVRDDVAKANIGPKYERFMPFLLTVFFFILLNNLMGLIPFFPGGANVSGNISITLTLAVFTFILTILNGTRYYWGHILAMPGVPKWVLIILTPVEILGVFMRPLILMIRLFANITAGHIIVLSFFALIFIFGQINAGLGYGISIVSLAFTIFMSMLELLVAFIQAFVFTFLSAMYLGAAIEEPHPDHHH
jgi:F-type H+-transporting ATPase subunit a